jgi:hypothetical protein
MNETLQRALGHLGHGDPHGATSWKEAAEVAAKIAASKAEPPVTYMFGEAARVGHRTQSGLSLRSKDCIVR